MRNEILNAVSVAIMTFTNMANTKTPSITYVKIVVVNLQVRIVTQK